MRYQKNKRTKKSLLRGWPLAAASVAIILIILAAFLYARRDTEPTDTFATTANSETKGEPSTENPASSSDPGNIDPAPPSTDKDPSTGNAPNPSTNLKDPSDSTFVSNHNPKISAGLALDSVCNTSPGVTCKITFTKDGVSKSLPDKVTDSGGSAYWTWTLNDVGLTAGTWKVTATATLGTQTKTAADAQALEVSP